jgi:hypothetical protein
VAGSSGQLWKWHRRLGHLSFDLLSRLSGLNVVRELPCLKFGKDLVRAPCRHAKMVAASHLPLTDVMTERPCELLHMDLVGPAHVQYVGGKCVDVKSAPHAKHTASRISWLHTRGPGVRIRKCASQFFLKLTKDENN